MTKAHRMLLSLAILSGLICFARCVKIKLIAPVAGNSWTTGQHVNVNWEVKSLKSSTGDKISQIDLDLLEDKSDNLVANISFGVPVGNNMAEWVVNDDLETGNDYYVRITSVEDPKFVLMGPRFSIFSNVTKAASKNPATPKPAPGSSMNFFVSFMALVGFLLV